MSRQYRFPIVLALACFSVLTVSASFTSAGAPMVIEKDVEFIPNDNGSDGPSDGGDEGGDPEEILIRSRPAPPQENKFESEQRHSFPLEWLLRLTDLVRSLR